ncbi:GH116 family glycosyl hydrolase [Flavitalea sp. BT771]|uniref:GH116 family glycosyl hydrolase n=1 Tax=Flavitalea sp. BT771 TaxID=3063329 RepID=UPI0026E37285|nr:GH116 family glycosyl hydrolase [Flavitalea sp. BT771]MDO6430883.1 GH116 family glycosyl hydrolase [Flavitalea sp. BT771]MDV6218977.1 GH116 family glycosyl hydrolase [Flavitalea sp. BT771]
MQLISRKCLRLPVVVALAANVTIGFAQTGGAVKPATPVKKGHIFNGTYKGANLQQVAFPIGGIGAGMFCLEGTGAISHMSVRNNPEMFNEPAMFAAISIRQLPGSARVLEGPVPAWKKFGQRESGLGTPGMTWGLPRFREAEFLARFPFGEITLKDAALPLEVHITGWSPFIPTDADNSSLPAGALEYTFRNTGKQSMEYVFSYNARNFMSLPNDQEDGAAANHIRSIRQGFILSQDAGRNAPEKRGDFAIFTSEPDVKVDHCWFRGGWWDPFTMAWNNIEKSKLQQTDPVEKDAPGASLFVPFTLKPGEEKKIVLLMAWYVPDTHMRIGDEPASKKDSMVRDASRDLPSPYHKPWYSSKFQDINAVADYWLEHYKELRQHSALFRDAFYKSSLPPEVTEAIAANLTILKSPTVLRQYDGRFWAWEGCGDSWGSCHGSCTHVWNYAQAVSHLFPSLERSLRETEFGESQNADGHQIFRTSLPIRPAAHTFHAASDGQLGGIMKIYREWRISGDSAWLRQLYPRVKASLDYCIRTWDPRHDGAVEEPHHNTYDIEFWGPGGMTTSFYLGALEAMGKMGDYLGEDVSLYKELFAKGRRYMEKELYNGEYFVQRIRWTGLSAPDPVAAAKVSFGGGYSAEAVQLLQREGPKYQYGEGCLSDGVLGSWIARVCGLPEPVDAAKVKSHLLSVYKYNLKKDLTDHSNPQRPGYAIGNEGGLLLCSWPRGGKLSLPFVYSDEVWTGIEYQVASHLIFEGRIAEGLDIVRTCRERYDGAVRNPFDEYECGHWYARAMSSYALLEAFSGVRYDAVDKTLYIKARSGNASFFISTATGFGNVIVNEGKVTVKVVYGTIDVKNIKTT